jgi:hypothetical protein
MSRRPLRIASAKQDSERLTRVETLLEGLPDAIENAIKKALEAYTVRADHDSLVRRVESLEASNRETLARHSYSAGVSSVEKNNRSELQEWARTLTPLVFGVGATLVGSIWALQLGAG